VVGAAFVVAAFDTVVVLVVAVVVAFVLVCAVLDVWAVLEAGALDVLDFVDVAVVELDVVDFVDVAVVELDVVLFDVEVSVVLFDVEVSVDGQLDSVMTLSDVTTESGSAVEQPLTGPDSTELVPVASAGLVARKKTPVADAMRATAVTAWRTGLRCGASGLLDIPLPQLSRNGLFRAGFDTGKRRRSRCASDTGGSTAAMGCARNRNATVRPKTVRNAFTGMR
jgi:hypothetical protein